MKRGFVSLVFLLSLLNAFADVVQDQAQSDFGTWADLRPGGQKVELAQTFQPGIAGQLISIVHSGVSPGGDPEYPTTFSIVDTVAGVPGTNVLGSTVITNISAQTTVYFTNQAIFLETNSVYAIVISTEAPLTSSREYSFRCSFGDSYPSGSLWSRPPGGNWSLAFVEISPTNPMDLVFATFMEPGIPDIRIVQPEQFSKANLGQPVPVVCALPSYVTNAASVDFYASNTLVGTASTPPYSINWTPVDLGTNLLYAVLSKTDGSSVTSAVQQVIVTDGRPVNDDFAQRLLLSGEVQTASIDQANATTEIGEPQPFAVSAGKTIWWQWTPPRTARATVVVTPAPQDNALLSIFTGSQLQSLYLLTNHSGLITQLVQGGTNYQISLDSASNALSGASLAIALNDIEITQPASQTQLSAPATFTLTANRTATTRNLTNVTAFANQISLGTLPLNTGTMVCSVTNSGYYNLELAATDTNGITTYSMDVPVVIHPGNDNYADAQTVSGRSIAIHASNLAATMQLTGGPRPFFPVYGEPTWGDNQGGHSIWYKWTAPADGLCIIKGIGASNFQVLIDACVGSDVDSASVVAGNALAPAFSPVVFDAIAGTTYYISLDGMFGEEGQIDWTLQLNPYNDDFANRRLLVGLNNQFQDSNSGATLETGETPLLPSGTGSSLWYTWQAPVSGQAVVNVSGTNALTLGIFKGDALSNLVLVATNAGGWTNAPSVTFPAEEGVSYQIGVFGSGDSSGSFNFQIGLQGLRLTSPLPNSIFAFPATLHLAAQLNVPGETLTSIAFKVNSTAVGASGPFTLDWTVPTAGTYTVSASGITSDNKEYDSPPVTCLVYADKHMPRPRVYAGVGSDTSYVINAVGALYEFGANSGQFGWPSTNEPSTPFLAVWPTNVTGWKAISGGWAISDSGQLYQNGTTLIPLPAGVTGWKAVSSGFENVVTISDDGELYLGGTRHLDVPRPPGGWRDVQASITDVNNMALALGEDNQAYGIGFQNQYGQWDYSSGLLTPPAGVEGWKQIAQAALFSVLMTTNGELYIYGEYGGVTGTSGTYGWSYVPKPAGVNHWVDVAAGGFHVLAIGDNAQLYCWGRDWEHQLGLGGGQDTVATPALVPLPPGVTGWSAVAGGQFHSLAIGNDCSVYAWGDNGSGQDGQPASADLTRPFQVGTLEALCGTPVIFTDGNASRLPDGSFRLQFNTDLNRAYLVQYSDDFKTWKTANSTIIGTGDLMEWIDNGPPKTDTTPASSSGRAYRVIYAP